MSRTRHLVSIAAHGFADMGPALRQAFNASSDDDNLDAVYGPYPRTTIVIVALLALAIGVIPSVVAPDHPIVENVNWHAVAVSIAFAAFIRRYLFNSNAATIGDFAWLAASTIPALAAVMVLAAITRFAGGELEVLAGAPVWTIIGGLSVIAAQAVGVVAGMTIALAALCYSRNWPRALMEVAGQLFVLKLTMTIVFFVMLEIGITDRILSAIFEAVFGFRLPSWIGEFADELTYTGVSLAIYLAIIGATWTVCRQSFGELLGTGQVNIIRTVRELVDPNEKEKREKKEAKAAKRKKKKASK